MKKQQLTMHIPKEIATALSRRRNGREDITREEMLEATSKMNFLYSQWEAAKKHLDWVLDVFWEEEEIEKHFGEPKFYGAHRRLQNARKRVKETHRSMFYLLTCTDGNYEPFSFDSMSAQEVYDDFMAKYVPRLKEKPQS